MKKLFKGGRVINVFTSEILSADVLIEDGRIIGVGDYSEEAAEQVIDVGGKILSPGFIDGHIHIESTMLTPTELAKLCLPRGTTAIVADPHEIANVCGTDGIKYMLEASEGLPMTVYINLPSCVPSTPFDESGAVLTAADLRPFYGEKRVLGLAEMMNYPGVLYDDHDVHEKLRDALSLGRPIDGHAPLLSGSDLNKYVASGIQTDHECSNSAEAIEKLRLGQWIMIREGTAARNLEGLLPLFAPEYSSRCLLVTDDRTPSDIASDGHIDHIIRKAVSLGASAVTAVKMATIQAALCFGLKYVGAIAPGYKADILVLDDLDTVDVRDVYISGERVVENKTVCEIKEPRISGALRERVEGSFHVEPLKAEDFHIEERSEKCRVIRVIPGQLVTDEGIERIKWEENNGIDTERDILKLAVIERHKNTGHIGLGFIGGIGLKQGAIASSVSHDSHNIIVIGTNDGDMAAAANAVRSSGGNAVVRDGEVVAALSLPVGGLMSNASGEEVSIADERVINAVHDLGTPEDIEPFMNMNFVSLPVIPSLKMTTQGLVDVTKFERVSLYVTEE